MNTRNLPIITQNGNGACNGNCQPALDPALCITRQAQRWAAFALKRSSLRPKYVHRKALSSAEFSVRVKANSLAVPSKLCGTRDRQTALRTLSDFDPKRGHQLEVTISGERLVVSFAGITLGMVQPKHVPWFKPLISFGARVHLLKVTGTDSPEKFFGCNVAFTELATAMHRLERTGDDGSPGECSVDTKDVLLWRDRDGVAQADVPHVIRHSPTGIEWGYGGSGPADLALSVLCRFTSRERAERLHQRFKHNVISTIPKQGGRIEAAFVMSWPSRQRD